MVRAAEEKPVSIAAMGKARPVSPSIQLVNCLSCRRARTMTAFVAHQIHNQM
jgi:hypothetical protein